jgi:hypothetical protein
LEIEATTGGGAEGLEKETFTKSFPVEKEKQMHRFPDRRTCVVLLL